jgi:hypothetical protein
MSYLYKKIYFPLNKEVKSTQNYYDTRTHTSSKISRVMDVLNGNKLKITYQCFISFLLHIVKHNTQCVSA